MANQQQSNANGAGTSNVNQSGDSSDRPTVTPITIEGNVADPTAPQLSQVASQTESGNTSQPSTSNGKKRKEMESRSVVWKHFEKIRDQQNLVYKARCVYCARVFAARTKVNGTSGLKFHMKKCKKSPLTKDMRQSLLTVTPSASVDGAIGSVKLGSWIFNQDAVRDALANMVILDELPFRFVEGEGFKQFVSVACPLFKIPSRWTVHRDCNSLFKAEKLKLKAEFKNHSQRVCFTTDTWTSIQRINYMCLTAHWIDDGWNLNKRILSFVPINGHKGDDIAKALDSCLLDWGLVSSVYTITVDNASSNDAAMSSLKDGMVRDGLVVGVGKYLHMRCIAHILNLVVSDGLKEMNPSISRVRAAVRYIRNSPSRIKKFNDIAELLGVETKRSLCLDVPTRWNSTYVMLEVACLYARVFEKYEKEEPCFKYDLEKVPDHLDWITVRKFSECLEHFYNITVRISGSKYVTANMHFSEIYNLNAMLYDMMKSSDEDLKKMGRSMKTKFDKYWGDPQKMNKVIFLANVFDPSYKLKYTLFSLKTMFGDEMGLILFTEIKYELEDLFDEYNTLYNGSASISHSQPASTIAVSEVESSNVVGVVDKQPVSLMKARYMQEMNEMGASVRQKTELELYLEESCVNEENPDVLKWWKQNAARFPILSRLARDILAVPVSTVASESAFSAGGRVLDCFRSSLTPNIVEALICTQDWLRPAFTPLDIEESLDDLDQFYKDLNI